MATAEPPPLPVAIAAEPPATPPPPLPDTTLTMVTRPARQPGARTPSDVRAQVIDSEVIEMATPSAEHGNAQAGIVACLRRLFHRRVGGQLPGGWWIMTEVEIEFEPDQLFIPDVIGWRRSPSAHPPTARPVTP